MFTEIIEAVSINGFVLELNRYIYHMVISFLYTHIMHTHGWHSILTLTMLQL